MSKSEYRQTIKAGAALSVLIEKFPATFFHFTRKPLKLHIHQDLLARGVAPDTIANGVGYYCRRLSYLGALKTGATGIDLDGLPAGVVTAEEAQVAVRLIAEAVERGKQVVVASRASEKQKRAAKKKAKALGQSAAAP
jgi:ProP effector